MSSKSVRTNLSLKGQFGGPPDPWPLWPGSRTQRPLKEATGAQHARSSQPALARNGRRPAPTKNPTLTFQEVTIPGQGLVVLTP